MTDKPPDKLETEILDEGGLVAVRLAGTIDEDFGGKALAAKVKGELLILHLGGIKKISSFGIREWVDFIGAVGAQTIILVECAPKVIDQINMVANFTGRGHVLSFYAPFRCDYCDSEHRILMRTDADVEVIKAKKLADRPCPSCKQPMYFDDDGATFFSYLATQPAFEPDPRVIELLRTKMNHPIGERRLKIDKRVDGKVTFLRFSGGLDRGFPRGKLAEGLEGTVIADVHGVDAIEPAGAAEWRAFVRDITPGIDWLLIAGASPAFVERLCSRDDVGDKGIVLSLALPYRCDACTTTGPAMIEVALHHDVLKFATAPSLPCPKCNAKMTCVATEAAMTVLPGLRLPTTNDRALYMKAKSPPPQLRVVQPKRRSLVVPMLLVSAVFATIVVASIWLVVFRQPTNVPPHVDPPITVKGPLPAWTRSTGCDVHDGLVTCTAASYPAATADDADAEAVDAALDALAGDVGSRISDPAWKQHVLPAFAPARASQLAAAGEDPSLRREVRETRRTVATRLRDAMAQVTPKPIATRTLDTYVDRTPEGAIAYVQVALPRTDEEVLADALRYARTALGATAVTGYPSLAWGVKRYDSGAMLVAVEPGPLADLGAKPGDLVVAIDGHAILGADDFAPRAEDYLERVKTGGSFSVQLLAADGTRRELTKQLPAPHAGTGSQQTVVPTGGINVWDRTNGRNDPRN